MVDEMSEELGLSMELTFNLHLVLEEAITNVINYAYTDQLQHEFTLDALTKDDMLTLTLVDDGQPFNPTEVPEVDVTLSADDRQIGGLGVFLIMKLMDKVTYRRENQQNILIMQKFYK